MQPATRILPASIGIACALFAQGPQFEAATVKPAAPDARVVRCAGGPGTSDPALLTCENYSLSYLVMMAYDLRSFQLVAPGWMDSARFNVAARIPSGADRKQVEAMQQHLLAERFGLQAHFEKKEMTVYELAAAKNGPKLEISQEPAEKKPESVWRPPPAGPPRPMMAHVTLKGQSATDIANFLSNMLGQPVVDHSGLNGRYDYELTFQMQPGGRAAGPAADAAAPELGTSLVVAVREQLGLTLEKKRGTADVLVVDRADRVPRD